MGTVAARKNVGYTLATTVDRKVSIVFIRGIVGTGSTTYEDVQRQPSGRARRIAGGTLERRKVIVDNPSRVGQLGWERRAHEGPEESPSIGNRGDRV